MRYANATRLAWFAIGFCFILPAFAGNEVWRPGFTYDTTVQYTFISSNATLSVGGVGGLDGHYKSDEVRFDAVIRHVTDDIQARGANAWAFRRYNEARIGLSRAEKNKKGWVWEYDEGQGFIGRRREDVSRIWNSRSIREALGDYSIKGGETFDPFAFAGEGGNFDKEKQKLELCWKREPPSEIGDVRLVGITCNEHQGSNHSKAPESIANSIKTENRLYLSALFGEMLFGDNKTKDKKEWTIEADKLNALLLGTLRERFKLDGTLRVRRSRLKPSVAAKHFGKGQEFYGVVVRAMDFDGVKFKYNDSEDGKYENWLEFNDDGKSVSPGSFIELYFDGVSECLRGAEIKIHIDHYEGPLPNPKLGARTSKASGKVNGSFTFTCNLYTIISSVSQGDNEQ